MSLGSLFDGNEFALILLSDTAYITKTENSDIHVAC